MTGTTTLICPKCRAEMRTYERSGVIVDQCEECRGIFLDRGELERLLDAGAAHEQAESRPDNDKSHDHDDDRGGRRRTSPSSFLSDLLGG